MRRATARILQDALNVAAARNPLWQALFEPLRDMARALDDPRWAAAAAAAGLARQRLPHAPLLDGAVIPAPVDAIVRQLSMAAGAALLPDHCVALTEAAIVYDRDRIDALAAKMERDPASLAAIAGLAATPLLYACARAYVERIPASWSHGYCPVCGAWPVLAELMGVDRARRLRCGRCAANWGFPHLTCLFCGEHDHHRLGSLVPEATRETRFIEKCESCRGYIKTLTTLTPAGAVQLTVQDIETVEFDIAALERGFARPRAPGFALRLALTS